GGRRLRHRRLSRRASRPAHMGRRDGRDHRHRGARSVARLGLRPAEGGAQGRCLIPSGSPSRRPLHPHEFFELMTKEAIMAPRVLVSDKLSTTAVQIFKDRGVEVDYLPDLGKDKDKLLEVIGQYDGLAIRSATKVTEKVIAAATNPKVIGRAGIGVDNVDIPAASRRG